jgi:membrane protein
VALAVFSAFPMFAKLQDVLQKWLVDSLIPDNIARQVLGYLTSLPPRPAGWGAGFGRAAHHGAGADPHH